MKTKSQLQDAALLKALRSYGYLFPETEDEVEMFEKLFGHEKIELPESLRDSSFLFREPRVV